MQILLDKACSTTVDSGVCLINHIKKNLLVIRQVSTKSVVTTSL